MGFESVLQVGGKALTQVTKKAYIKPMCEVRTLESLGLKMEQFKGACIEINPAKKIKSLQARLESVLRSPYCEMPDYMKLIPKGASQEETIAYLQKMFQESKFFSREFTCEMRYGKNFEFAKRMSKLANESSKSISTDKSFDSVLKHISNGYPENDFSRFAKIGVYRGDSTEQPLIVEGMGRIDGLQTGYGKDAFGQLQYEEYIGRLDRSLNRRLSPYCNFTLTKGYNGGRKLMIHPYPEEVVQNMDIISERYKIYQHLVKEYKVNGKLTLEQKKQADEIISEIYYLMANTCPFYRGSNGISDVLMRSQYSALGITKSHVKKGVGLDLEAFCMDLKEYQMKWNSFFE